MQNMKQDLADAVREARTECGLSQEKLAEAVYMDTRTILNIEAGRGNPKFEKLYPIAMLLVFLSILLHSLFQKKHQPAQYHRTIGKSLLTPFVNNI